MQKSQLIKIVIAGVILLVAAYLLIFKSSLFSSGPSVTTPDGQKFESRPALDPRMK